MIIIGSDNNELNVVGIVVAEMVTIANAVGKLIQEFQIISITLSFENYCTHWRGVDND